MVNILRVPPTVTHNGQDYQTMVAGTMYQAVGNPCLKFP